jgi:beta-glucosidase
VYSDLRLDRNRLTANDPLHVSLKVRNSGQRAGDEAVQLYLRPVSPQREQAIRELRGFQRVTLQAGEEREVSFAITPARDLRIYDDAAHAYAVDPGSYEAEVGASSADIRLSGRFAVEP